MRMATQLADTFKVALFPIPVSEDGGVSGGVDGGVNELLDVIHHNPGVNVSRLRAMLQISKRTLERHLHKLRDDKKIEFRGAPKTGGYFIK